MAKSEKNKWINIEIPEPGIDTQLPGVDSSKVIPSHPLILRENALYPSKKNKKKSSWFHSSSSKG